MKLFHLVLLVAICVGGRSTAAPTDQLAVGYDNLRGTNYVFNSSHMIQDEFALLSFPGDGPVTTRMGTYSRKNVESELAAIAAAGFNNVRVTPSFFAWVIDNAQFETNLRHFIRACRRDRLTITWVLWTAIGNAPYWQVYDLAAALDDSARATHNDALHAVVVRALFEFQSRYGALAPAHRLGYSSAYPFPGNNLLRASGDPARWTQGAMGERVERYLDALLGIIGGKDGRATLFQIDLGNELDTIGGDLNHVITFLKWNYVRVKRALRKARVTVGWAAHSVGDYTSYVVAMERAGIELDRHSFHIYVQNPDDYAKLIDPLLSWAAGRKNPIELMCTEFYRTDTAEWHRLGKAFAYFASRGVPTIMWGYITSGIFAPNGIRLDGVIDASNAQGTQSFHVPLQFTPRSSIDYGAVLTHNGVGG